MTYTYRKLINDMYDDLSPSYQRVADYVLTNYMEVAFMTAAELAAETSVDTTSVVRFAQRIGFRGYPEFLADVRQHVRGEVFGVMGYGKAAYEGALKAWVDYENVRRAWAADPSRTDLAISSSTYFADAKRITAELIGDTNL